MKEWFCFRSKSHSRKRYPLPAGWNIAREHPIYTQFNSSAKSFNPSAASCFHWKSVQIRLKDLIFQSFSKFQRRQRKQVLLKQATWGYMRNETIPTNERFRRQSGVQRGGQPFASPRCTSGRCVVEYDRNVAGDKSGNMRTASPIRCWTMLKDWFFKSFSHFSADTQRWKNGRWRIEGFFRG